MLKVKSIGQFERAQSLKFYQYDSFSIVMEITYCKKGFSVKKLFLKEGGKITFYLVIGFKNEYQVNPDRLKKTLELYDVDDECVKFHKAYLDSLCITVK